MSTLLYPNWRTPVIGIAFSILVMVTLDVIFWSVATRGRNDRLGMYAGVQGAVWFGLCFLGQRLFELSKGLCLYIAQLCQQTAQLCQVVGRFFEPHDQEPITVGMTPLPAYSLHDTNNPPYQVILCLTVESSPPKVVTT
ncbi:hypothetical protein BDR07DRAFT_1498294 [Suillus spraguei]|nr:hypothetical protein BDR07DRAFT_1498294 [Suillus spraguei]